MGHTYIREVSPKLCNFDQKKRAVNIDQGLLNDINEDTNLLKRITIANLALRRLFGPQIKEAHKRTEICKD